MAGDEVTSTSDEDKESDLPEKDESLIISMLNSQLERQNGVVGGLYQRASILVGASGISTALLTREGLPIVWLLPIGMFVASIVMAVLSLLFQRGKAVAPEVLVDGWRKHDRARFHSNAMNALNGAYKSVGESIEHRARLLSAGMILFASGWVLSLTILVILALQSL